ncbi:MAG: S8 family serine peptidase [Candidatus Eremiobacteraeota bacterium]|nr:S8 family serine peptidase [Candidatus Eremiobacteraeota bacterium]
MAKKRVTLFWLHDEERDAVLPLLSSIVGKPTQSFAVGDIDENDIAKAEAAGAIVQEQQPPPVRRVAPSPRQSISAFGFAMAAAPVPAPDEGVPAELDYYALDLSVPLIEDVRNALQTAGATIMEALPEGGYKIRAHAGAIAAIRSVPGVEAVTWIAPSSAAPKVAVLAAAPAGAEQQPVKMVAWDARLHDPTDVSTIVTWLGQQHLTIAGSGVRKVRFYAPPNAPVLDDLARRTEVETIEQYVPPKLFADVARQLLGADAATAVGPAPGVALDGSGQIVAIADTGIDQTHPDFTGRIKLAIARGRANDASDPEGHGTHVAGCALGDGTASGGKVKGMAPKATLVFQSLLDDAGGLGGLPVDLNQLFQESYDAGARIQNASWGNSGSSVYAINSEEVDEFVYNHPDMLIVVAAGNDGSAAAPQRSAAGFVDWYSIASPASCKNAITVGASRSSRTDGALSASTWAQSFPSAFPNDPIASQNISGDPNALAGFSSRGPCDDRRIKPDVVAPGTDIAAARSSLAPVSNFWGPYTPDPAHYAYDGGTSMASPLVAGAAALVRQYYTDVAKHQPSAALLKATLVNSTAWLTGADATAAPGGTPSYHQGHGRVDVSRAVPNASRPNFMLFFDDNYAAGAGLAKTGDAARFQVTVPAGIDELRICLAYTDLPARGLQNSLGLIVQLGGDVKKYTGNQNLPDAPPPPDRDNNLQSVRIPTPGAGVYYIQVMANNLLKGPQAFALVVTGDSLTNFAPY